jgi:hypothetical protein
MFPKKAEGMRTEAKVANVHRRAEKAKAINKNTRQAAGEAKTVRKALTKSAAEREIRKNRGVEILADRIQRSQRELQRFGTDASTAPAKPAPMLEIMVSTASSADRLRNSIRNAWGRAE